MVVNQFKPPFANCKDMSGVIVGRWTVLRFLSHRRKCDYWLCRCECGTEKPVSGYNLRKGATKSCGCYAKLRTSEVRRIHGLAHTATYNSWAGMIARCTNPSHNRWHRYGAIGITVCKRWQTFANFLADMGKRPSAQHSIERRDNLGNYTAENCYWATAKQQARNRRTTLLVEHGGRTQSLAAWAEELGLNYKLLHRYLKKFNGDFPAAIKRTPSCRKSDR